MGMRYRIFMLVLCVVCFCSSLSALADGGQPTTGIVTIEVTSAHKIATLRPLHAIGSTVDKEPAGSIPALYSKRNVQAMLDAGLGWLSYRLFTELSDQDWHWNPAGTFTAGDSGYWTSSASAGSAPITDSFGYRLPHSGNTTDQGNNEGYSRLDDGDPRTYWKSDPYLTSAYTGEPDDAHPQWVVVDLGQRRPVNDIKIEWANPYAKRYSVEYWTGDDPINDPGTGTWSRIAFKRDRLPRTPQSTTGPRDMLVLAPLERSVLSSAHDGLVGHMRYTWVRR